MREPGPINTAPNGSASVCANNQPTGVASNVLSLVMRQSPGMRRRRDENEPGDALRIIERESQRQRAAPGMADDDGAIDAEPIEHVAQHGRLIGRRAPLAGLARAEAEARPIDENDAVTRGEPLAEREMHVLEIGAGAVEKHDRRRALRVGASLPVRSHADGSRRHR